MKWIKWLCYTLVATYLMVAITIGLFVWVLGGPLLIALAVGFSTPFKLLFGR